jgi:protein-L-isoaspartate(D-aspartate) O-methyltransferase
MVETEIVASGIKDPRVLQSLRSTPRHEFLPAAKRQLAYFDMAVPIGHQQTISPPYVVAYMTERLDPQPTDKVLEIGTGSGYQAAVLSPLVKEVYTIEIVAQLGRRAASVLRRLGYRNVHTKIGDGYQGWPEHAPFDKIIVTCSPEKVPQPLIDQLAEGGVLVVPLGERFQQALYLFRKKGGKLIQEALEATFFVPMTGVAEERRAIKPDAPLTELANGSFEEVFAATKQPTAWYYIRQGQVESGSQTPAGERHLSFTNTTPGRNAHGMQAIGVDGRVVRGLQITLLVRGEQLQAGPLPGQQPQLALEFYDSQRAPVGSRVISHWEGTFPWRTQVVPVPVPPQARLAVIGIGLFGGTGRISFDDVQVVAVAPQDRVRTSAAER